MQTMKNAFTWAALGLIGYLVYRQYQKNNAPTNTNPQATLPQAPQERVSM